MVNMENRFYKFPSRIKAVVWLLCLLLVFPYHTVNATDEAPAVEWDRTYGAISGQTVFPTGDGGYIIGGTTGDWVDGRGGGDWTNNTFMLIKIDADGEVVWKKNCTRGSLRTAILTSDGGYAMTASIEADLIKTDSDGNIQWTKNYAAFDDAHIFSVIQTGDGGFAIVGAGDHPISGMEGRFVKTDSEGDLQWNKSYGELHMMGDLRSIVQTTDEGYALTGLKQGDMWLVKTDSNGNVQWEKMYGGEDDDGCMIAIRTTDGGYILAGYTYSFGAGDFDCFVVKTDSWGNMQWKQTYGGSGRDGFRSVVQSIDGGYVLTGFVNNTDSDRAAVVVKLSASGEFEWEKFYPGEDTIQAVVLAADGGYIFAGTKGSSRNSDSEVWAVKLAPDSSLVEEEPDEFPFWVILPAVVVTALVALLVKRWLNKKLA